MRMPPQTIANVSVCHGSWGEDIAIRYLQFKGYEIVDRNSRPEKKDRRLEIDIVAFDNKTDTLVFVEVKQHADFSPYARRLRSVNRRKKENLRRACNAWRRINRWHGSYRFDVIEIYGNPEEGSPIIDHIDHVELFVRRERFVKWA